jgi:Flp pilus assembly protein TadG
MARRDRGSVSIWLAASGMVMIILVGLAVDLGGKVGAQQRAQDVARQAARAGGQQLQAAGAVRGDGVTVDPYAAQRAARTYLAGSGMTGTATVVAGQTVHVTTTATYQCTFLGIIGLSSFTVHGAADSRTTRSVDGVEQ